MPKEREKAQSTIESILTKFRLCLESKRKTEKKKNEVILTEAKRWRDEKGSWQPCSEGTTHWGSGEETTLSH